MKCANGQGTHREISNLTTDQRSTDSNKIPFSSNWQEYFYICNTVGKRLNWYIPRKQPCNISISQFWFGESISRNWSLICQEHPNITCNWEKLESHVCPTKGKQIMNYTLSLQWNIIYWFKSSFYKIDKSSSEKSRMPNYIEINLYIIM